MQYTFIVDVSMVLYYKLRLHAILVLFESFFFGTQFNHTYWLSQLTQSKQTPPNWTQITNTDKKYFNRSRLYATQSDI